MEKPKLASQKRRLARVRKSQKRGTRLRLSVYRSNRFISAQIIDDQKGKTVVSVSEQELAKSKDQTSGRQEKSTKTKRARLVGELLAAKAAKHKVKEVLFDRGNARYHGRILELAKGAREKGLKF